MKCVIFNSSLIIYKLKKNLIILIVFHIITINPLFKNLHNFNLRYIEQFKLLFSSPLYAWNDFPLITAERYIFPVNIPVATFQFLNQSAFGYLPVSNQTVTAHIKT